jgi:hypothetical protein
VKEAFDEIPVVTTFHDAQVVDAVPYEEMDEKITEIVTPTRVIHVSDQFDLQDSSAKSTRYQFPATSAPLRSRAECKHWSPRGLNSIVRTFEN